MGPAAGLGGRVDGLEPGQTMRELSGPNLRKKALGGWPASHYWAARTAALGGIGMSSPYQPTIVLRPD